jgi:aspartate racemase
MEDSLKLTINWGVLGGMGPLVSSKFAADVYSACSGQVHEQQMPSLLVLHQPRFPDRTKAIREGRQEDLLRLLTEQLQRMVDIGCDQIMVTCFTLHSVFDKLPTHLHHRLLNLIIETDGQLQQGKEYLVLCTNGSRQQQIFGRNLVKDGATLRYPVERDQQKIHELIYQLKQGSDCAQVWQSLELILAKYSVDGIVAGCTEIYLVWQSLNSFCDKRQLHHVDALMSIGKRLSKLDRNSKPV